MSTEIVVALISVGGVFLSAIVSCITTATLTNWRINQLEKKVEEHNKWGDKFASQGTDIQLLNAKLDNVQKDLSELKEFVKTVSSRTKK